MDADQVEKGLRYQSDEEQENLINAALILRRPLLITGKAGIGKSTLAYAVARQLGLGNVLRWGITSRSSLQDALYEYDAIARLRQASLAKEESSATLAGDASKHDAPKHDASKHDAPKHDAPKHDAPKHDAPKHDATQDAPPLDDIGDYIALGPLGTALLPTRAAGYFPRVLLIDEIDKSDADLPSDLLHVLEEGRFFVPEVARVPKSRKGKTVQVSTADPLMGNVNIPTDGWVRCDDFPFIVMTSNGERDFPPAFLRRCLRLDIKRKPGDLERIVKAHLESAAEKDAVKALINDFGNLVNRDKAELATDQLLNAIYLLESGYDPLDKSIQKVLFRPLDDPPGGLD